MSSVAALVRVAAHWERSVGIVIWLHLTCADSNLNLRLASGSLAVWRSGGLSVCERTKRELERRRIDFKFRPREFIALA